MLGKREVLRGEVQSMIVDRLTAGLWEPGQRLSIEALARDLDVSPTPVREALASIERFGPIEYHANRGYIVAPPLTSEQLGEIIDARQVIESAALSRAFVQWPSFVDELRERHAEHAETVAALRNEQSVDFSLVQKHFAADAEFHGTFFRYAGNRYLDGMRNMLGWDVHRTRQTWAEGPEHVDSEDALREHAKILACVEDRNHDGALRALHDHLESVRQRAGGTHWA
ncbi:GntR family transcriptional regulator [Psychromicrobium xiongbiense]|uniref:GntR family transcriptional regulator n=1 Tax=Psychromicrobium xiongbiense TaxID=3051184 RepID=UPI0025574C50|nr:GntR family transcriptional regulator [Psychromicrobium sp. YIM S02556]